MKQLRESLRQLRLDHNLTQAVIADGMGMNTCSVCQMELGNQEIPLKRLSDYLKAIDPEAVLTISVTMKEQDGQYRTTTLSDGGDDE